jgi:hypothetical protein
MLGELIDKVDDGSAAALLLHALSSKKATAAELQATRYRSGKPANHGENAKQNCGDDAEPSRTVGEYDSHGESSLQTYPCASRMRCHRLWTQLDSRSNPISFSVCCCPSGQQLEPVAVCDSLQRQRTAYLRPWRLVWQANYDGWQFLAPKLELCFFSI